MKNFAVKLIAVLLFISLPHSAYAQLFFHDLGESEYVDSINALTEAEIINGYGDGTFRPGNPINRAEFLKLVVEALPEEASVSDAGLLGAAKELRSDCFPDVTGQWFAPYVCEAKEFGFIKGYDDGFYRPGREINRIEAYKIALNALDMGVRDPVEGEQWYAPYLDFVHQNEIFSKYNAFWDQPISREEVAYLVDQLLRIKNGERAVKTERQVLSAGCGQIPPSVPPQSFSVEGLQRSTITVVPDGYDANRPVALIFGYHGRTSPNWQVRQYYELERAAGNQAIYIYPAGAASGSSATWSSKDFQLFDEMVSELSAQYCVDQDRIYAIGHSLGAWFVNSLACARGDVLRGVGTLGGSRMNLDCSGPVAVMQWHNPNDRLAAFSGGVAARDAYLEQNSCGGASVAVEPAWGNCVQYQGCYDTAPTLWCPHTNNYNSWNGSYYPHNWPKGTGAAMWSFLDTLP